MTDTFDQYDTETKSRLPFKKRWLFLGILLIVIIIAVAALIHIYPKKDRINTDDLPEKYMVENDDNFYAFQSGKDCTGYATAYVMRHFGIEASGHAIYKEMGGTTEGIMLYKLVDELERYGLQAKMLYGIIDTLKAELNKGAPVIAFINIVMPHETERHCVAVMGYDEEYIYIADSTEVKANVYDQKTYDRKLTYEEFEDLWDTGAYPFIKNCYIVAEKQE